MKDKIEFVVRTLLKREIRYTELQTGNLVVR